MLVNLCLFSPFFQWAITNAINVILSDLNDQYLLEYLNFHNYFD